jgi:transcription initiation factor TFIID subunit 2
LISPAFFGYVAWSSSTFSTLNHLRRFKGYTEITIVPKSIDLKTIHLHSRQCSRIASSFRKGILIHAHPDIHSVTVGSQQAEFTHHDPLSNINISSAQDCHNHPELKRKVYSALAECDEGELSIVIPREVQLQQSENLAAGIFSEGELYS